MFYLLGYSSSAAAISCDEDDDKNDDVAERRRDEKLAQLSPLISPHFGGIYQIRIREKTPFRKLSKKVKAKEFFNPG